MDPAPRSGSWQSYPFKSAQTILNQEIDQAELEMRRPALGLFISGLLAGICVGFSVLLLVTVMSLYQGDPSGAGARLLVASAYTVGFMLVIIGQMDLFTEYTTIAILPVLSRQATLYDLGRLWSLVYGGNILGSSVIAVLLTVTVPALGVADSSLFQKLAHELVKPSWWVILLSAILAGWLMGLLSWLLVASRETVSQITLIWIVAGTIGFTHLHHSIVGSVEMLAGIFSGAGLTLGDFAYFLVWATLGNSVGGIAFAAMVAQSTLLSSPRSTRDHHENPSSR